jgi:hypothetical protein
MKKIVLAILISGCIACANKKHEGIYKQGRIDYKITYLNADNGNFNPSLLPKKMVLEFNEKFCTNSIDGFMGFFRLSNFTVFGKKKSTTFLKVLDKSYIFYGTRQELMCCFDTFKDMIIETDTITRVYAGLKSQYAKATIPSTGDVFEIYYTHDINLDHPNVTNPYLDIDGVLTDFVLYMGPYKMRFEAQKFDPNISPTELTEIPKDASKVSREEMVYALDRLMSK